MENQLSPEERSALMLAKHLESLLMHPGYQQLRTAIGQWRDKARTDMERCRSTSDKVVATFSRRYAERTELVEFIDSYISEASEVRRQIIRDLAELNNLSGLETEDLVSALDSRPQ